MDWSAPRFSGPFPDAALPGGAVCDAGVAGSDPASGVAGAAPAPFLLWPTGGHQTTEAVRSVNLARRLASRPGATRTFLGSS